MDDPPKLAVGEHIRRFRWWIAGLALVIIIWGLAQRTYDCDWTGFGSCPVQKDSKRDLRRGKTLWDWLSLAGAPLAIAAIGYRFNQYQLRNNRDNTREKALQTYLDRISTLLIEHNLRDQNEPKLDTQLASPIIRVVAQARTETVLHTLDGRRKGDVIRFLYEAKLIQRDKPVIPSKLIQRDKPVISLARANLQRVILENTKLQSANLRGANLRVADLRGANLQGANLQGANFKDATYASNTTWPNSFDPQAAGAIKKDKPL